jgi:HAD superfamily hydrolase (TIGR01509 family)
VLVPEPIRRPAAFLFDLDGTLVDTVALRVRAWRQAFAEAGMNADDELLGPQIGSDGRRLARVVAEALGRRLDDDAAERLDARAGRLYGELNTDPRPLPGARELLAALTAHGVPWAIATSSRPEQVRASVERLRLAESPNVFDGHRVSHAKPDPELLLVAAGGLRAAPARCWSVGDSTWDIDATTAAGMVAVGVTTGLADEGQLREHGAMLVVPSLARLHSELRERGWLREAA